MSFGTALEALTADAKRWDVISDGLDAARGAAASLQLDDADFSFAGGDLAASYESVRSRVQQLLRQGREETSGAAGTLLDVRRVYEGTDAAARADIEGLWTWE